MNRNKKKMWNKGYWKRCGASDSAVHNPNDSQEIILSEATDMKLRSILQKEIKKGMYNIAMDVEAKRLLPLLKKKRERR